MRKKKVKDVQRRLLIPAEMEKEYEELMVRVCDFQTRVSTLPLDSEVLKLLFPKFSSPKMRLEVSLDWTLQDEISPPIDNREKTKEFVIPKIGKP